MLRKFKRPLIIGLLIIFSALLSACASRYNAKEGNDEIKEIAHQGIIQLQHKHYKKARTYFSKGLRYNPRNCQFHFLNALSYQLEGKEGNYKLLELAKVGYKNAIKFCPEDAWSYYFYGVIALQQRNYSLADKLFKSAEKYNTDKNITIFLKAYLYSAYRCGDVRGAKVALGKLKAKHVQDPWVNKLGNLFSHINAKNYKNTLNDQHAQQQINKEFRHNKKQVIVDGVIILSREIANNTRGINLLDGLKLTYSGSYVNSHVNGIPGSFVDKLNEKGLGPSLANGIPFTHSVVHNLSLKDVEYNLNIFNDVLEQDEILARPSLLVENDKSAKYFSGSELILGLQGNEVSTIEKLPIGLTLNVTPHFEKDGTVNLNVKMARDFLVSSTALTTFQETAETIREDTETTVNLHYNETVILSALSESIEDEKADRVPVLGRIPLIRYLFNQKTKQRLQTNLLVLLTPQRYVSFDAEFESPTYQDLLNYYSRLVSPATNLVQTLRNLSRIEVYFFPDRLTPTLYQRDNIVDKALQQKYQHMM